ncbi:MAG: MFS transporter [Egibacteraceae bacterium]
MSRTPRDPREAGPAAARPALAPVVRLGEPAGRWVLVAAVLGSGIALLDATVVNVALPTLGEDLGASLGGLQWTVNAYTLTLAALILLGGSLGDRFGRRRVFLVGVVWFAVASLLCGAALSIGQLIAARALQGVGGALLTPGSLAMIQASFHPDDRARAIGAWSALGGIAAAIGPFLGGWLVEAVSWRWVFLINAPLAVVIVVLALRHVPETRDPTTHGRFDVAGAVLGALALGGITYALVEGEGGFAAPAVWGSAVVGVLGLVAFVVTERRGRNPMLPVDIFASRQFTAANLVTFAVYAALGGVFFFLVLNLQIVSGFTPIASGMALLPVTVLMLLLSERAGLLAQRIGPRLPMSAGPLVCAAGPLLLSGIGADATYVASVLPGVVVFGLGLSLTVAPLTATVLGAADVRHAGVASGVNNAVARAGGLLSVAALPLLVGLSGADYQDPARFVEGFRMACYLCAGLLAAGGVVAAATISNDVLSAGAPPAVARPQPQCRTHCAVAGTPLEPSAEEPAVAR